ncbi:hypothetical protein AVEN_106943-1 [Araneus ventricosus]|uniref:Uncharacterized protein n=1 Tax=Araneus ventricosus TaxID=182803 RepID=A0A4Y2GGM0_ARAVE|nr:hypothetical protein AVEN_106943-1 [Araneus ventricosus]
MVSGFHTSFPSRRRLFLDANGEHFIDATAHPLPPSSTTLHTSLLFTVHGDFPLSDDQGFQTMTDDEIVENVMDGQQGVDEENGETVPKHSKRLRALKTLLSANFSRNANKTLCSCLPSNVCGTLPHGNQLILQSNVLFAICFY